MNKLKEWLDRSGMSRNTMTKLVSLILALVLWIYVMDIENPEIVRSFDDIPINLINLERVESDGLLLANPTDLTVNVKLKGRRSELLNLPLSSIVVTADLYGANKGYNSIPLNFKIEVDNVYITNTSRNDLNIYLDKIVELPKKVEITIIGELPDGYSGGAVEATPQEVLVRGPEKLVNEVAKLTGELDISDLKKDLLKEIPIIPVDNDGNAVQGVEVKLAYVTAGIGVFKIAELPVELTTVGNVPEGYRITQMVSNPSTLRVSGKEEDVLYYTKIAPEAIDIQDKTESFEITLPLKLPEKLTSVDIVDSLLVKVTIEKLMTATYTYDFKDISFLNMNSALSVAEGDFQVVVHVKGIESVITGLSKEDISLLVDLKDLQEGFHSVSLQLKSDADLDNINADVEMINIQLED